MVTLEAHVSVCARFCRILVQLCPVHTPAQSQPYTHIDRKTDRRVQTSRQIQPASQSYSAASLPYQTPPVGSRPCVGSHPNQTGCKANAGSSPQLGTTASQPGHAACASAFAAAYAVAAAAAAAAAAVLPAAGHPLAAVAAAAHPEGRLSLHYCYHSCCWCCRSLQYHSSHQLYCYCQQWGLGWYHHCHPDCH